MDCQLAQVEVTGPTGVVIGNFTVPAFTRTNESFSDVLGNCLATYMRDNFGRPSVADFAFYLLNFAKDEPRVQEDLG